MTKFSLFSQTRKDGNAILNYLILNKLSAEHIDVDTIFAKTINASGMIKCTEQSDGTFLLIDMATGRMQIGKAVDLFGDGLMSLYSERLKFTRSHTDADEIEYNDYVAVGQTGIYLVRQYTKDGSLVFKRTAIDFDGATFPALTLVNPLAVANGGTGAATAAGARENIVFLGRQPIASVADDTVSNWAALGCGFAYYYTAGLLNGQPSTYGMVLNSVDASSKNVHQIWQTQPNGDIYHRGGNANGWSESWRKLFDSSSVIPVANGGTGAATVADAVNNLGFHRGSASVTYDASKDFGSNMTGNGYVKVPFSTPYKADTTPTVVVSVAADRNPIKNALMVASRTNEYFIVKYQHEGTGSVTTNFQWISLGTPA